MMRPKLYDSQEDKLIRKRPKLDIEKAKETASAYFSTPSSVTLFSSGCSVLDGALGGGWPEGRIVNIVGDKSTAKTGVAIEACANFALNHPNSKIHYIETEAAFDEPYAETLGLPLAQVKMIRDVYTVEDLFERLTKIIEKSKLPSLAVVDSLDAISDRAELARNMDDKTFGGDKPKKMGQLFRRLNAKMEHAKITLFIISQLRDKIGVTFGEKQTRTGGKALDFYATHIVWLAHIGQIKQTKNKVDRVVGINIKAKVKKNKIGPPFREAEFPVLFNYGIDDVEAGCSWLNEVGYWDEKKYGSIKHYRRSLASMDNAAFAIARKKLTRQVKLAWAEIEKTFTPSRRKY